LILLGLAAPPITFFGSILLLGAGHGPSIFWDINMTPAGLGFILPSAGALTIAFSRNKAPTLIGVIIAVVTLLIQSFATFQSPEGFSYIKRAIQVMLILTWIVAFLGPVTCGISIAAGLLKINYSRRVSEQA
jgi:hypothetical protein